VKNLYRGKQGFIYTGGSHPLLMPLNLTVTEIKQAIRHHKLLNARRSLVLSLNKRILQSRPIDYNADLKKLILKLSRDYDLADILDFIFNIEYDYGDSVFSMMEDKLNAYFNQDL